MFENGCSAIKIKQLSVIVLASTITVFCSPAYAQQSSPPLKETVFKEAAQGVQSVATTFAIVIGGVWTYQKFFERRKNKPKPNVKLQIQSQQLTPEHLLLRAELEIKNESEVLLKISRIKIWWQKILPLDPPLEFEVYQYKGDLKTSKLWGRDSQQINWPCIDSVREVPQVNTTLEPGEIESTYFDFIVDSKLRLLNVSTFIEDLKNPGTGWTKTVLYEVPFRENQ